MSVLDRIKRFLTSTPEHQSTPGVNRAIQISSELISKMRKDQNSKHPVTAMMADLWMQRHNVPYVTTVYEAAQEMDAAVAFSAKEQQKKQ
jgi:hypothetical protein